MKPKRICIASQKGGVGKTTVALNLAVSLAERGRSVLLADLDPQGAIALSLGRPDSAMPGIAELLMGRAGPNEAVTPTKLAGLSLLARGELDPIDVCEFEQAVRRHGRLDEILTAVERGFDYVLLDTPAGLGFVTRAGLACSEYAIVPMQSEMLALRSIPQILRVLEHIREQENPRLKLLGVLLTMVERRNDNAIHVMSELWDGFETVFDTVIPRAEVFADASRKGLPVAFLGGEPAIETRRFDSLASEIEVLVTRHASGHDGERPERSMF